MRLVHKLFIDYANIVVHVLKTVDVDAYCEAQARVRQGSARIGKGWPGKGQARIGKDWQGMAHKAKGLKASLPRAYIKVGCHLPPPTHPPERLIFTMFMASRVRGRYLGITESMLDQ